MLAKSISCSRLAHTISKKAQLLECGLSTVISKPGKPLSKEVLRYTLLIEILMTDPQGIFTCIHEGT